jgi:putative ABC transport system permease protein
MIHIALKMLLGDRGKYLMLVGGLTFAALLMTQQSAVFFGLMNWTTSHIRNIRATIWVVDRKVEQANEVKALRDTDVSRVRSVTGVGWAVPLYTSVHSAKLSDGNFKSILLVGLDNASLVGRPGEMMAGRLEDVRLPNSVIIDDLAVQRLSAGRTKPLGVGDSFEINDKEARIVGICKAERHFFGYPYVYTTYDQALQFAPKQRKMLSMVLVEPAPGRSARAVARQIEKETQLKAFTEDEFFWSTIWWYFRNTGIPFSFGTTILLGFLVGIAICGQTFYTFVLENLRHLGALKAMGASNFTLARMLLVQAWTVGVIGYGIGIGLTASFGRAVMEKGQPPFLLPYQLPLVTFVVIMLICTIAAGLGIWKICRVEPAIVFRG